MMLQRNLIRGLLTLSLALSGATYAEGAGEDALWLSDIKGAFFGDRVIETDEVIVLDAPKRAQNAAIVPVSITAGIPQTEERYIKTLWLIADRNPGPLAGANSNLPASGPGLRSAISHCVLM